MILNKKITNFIAFFLILILASCAKIPKPDFSKKPALVPNAKERARQNVKEGRGFSFGSKKNSGGDFLFASANELWRASLDTIDFMPLSSVNYSGGIIITDWYSDGNNLDESVKISIRFLTNEVRTDALDIKVFYKKCNQIINCKVSQKTGPLVAELKKEILSKAAIYKKQNKDKNFKEYKGSKRLSK